MHLLWVQVEWRWLNLCRHRRPIRRIFIAFISFCRYCTIGALRICICNCIWIWIWWWCWWNLLQKHEIKKRRRLISYINCFPTNLFNLFDLTASDNRFFFFSRKHGKLQNVWKKSSKIDLYRTNKTETSM